MAGETAAALRVVNEPTNGESFPQNIIAYKPESGRNVTAQAADGA